MGFWVYRVGASNCGVSGYGFWSWYYFFDLKQVMVCLLKLRVVCGDVFI